MRVDITLILNMYMFVPEGYWHINQCRPITLISQDVRRSSCMIGYSGIWGSWQAGAYTACKHRKNRDVALCIWSTGLCTTWADSILVDTVQCTWCPFMKGFPSATQSHMLGFRHYKPLKWETDCTSFFIHLAVALIILWEMRLKRLNLLLRGCFSSMTTVWAKNLSAI